MCNAEIIHGEMVLNGIMEPVDTYAGWQAKGKQVKKGSKALFKTVIWKPCKVGKAKVEAGAPETKMMMVKAAFFGESQVMDIEA